MCAHLSADHATDAYTLQYLQLGWLGLFLLHSPKDQT